MTNPTAAPEALATELVSAGAAPVQPDVSALLEQILKLQARVDDMSKAAGVPTDPIGAAIKDLADHVKARASANPSRDFTEVLDTINTLPETPSSKDAELVSVLVGEFVDAHKNVEGADYLRALAVSLHKSVLKSETGR